MKNLLTLTMLFILLNANSQCFEKIDAGYFFTLGLKSDNTLWAWGSNYTYEFGNGTTDGSLLPLQIGNESNWVAIATGANHSLALKSNGTMWSWGLNYEGQCGDGTTIIKTTPIQIGSDNDWYSISARSSISFAIKNNGTLWAWGYNYVGALGLGLYSAYETLPIQVGTENNWKEIIAGYDHTIAIKNDNTLWGWGSNGHGQLGNGVFFGNVLVPTQIGAESDWKTASPGHKHTIALKLDGSIWSWGGNGDGELGDGTTIDKNIPLQIGNETNWKFISADYGLTYAIKNDNTFWVWGNNDSYRFGNGTTISSLAPIQIGTDTDWKYITHGLFHKIGLKIDNGIYLWGVNPHASLSTMPNYTSITQFMAECTLSTTDFENSLVKVFPNPANENVNIINMSNETINNIKIFDITGKLLLSQSQNQEINVTSLRTGIYIVHIETEKLMRKYKLIKI